MGKISGSSFGTPNVNLVKAPRGKGASKLKSSASPLAVSNVFHIAKTDGSAAGGLSKYQLPDGIVSVNNFIPTEVQAILKAQFASVGLPFDIEDLAVRGDKDNRAQFTVCKQAVEMMVNNASLLPEWVELIKKAISVNVSSAKSKAVIAKEALKAQAKIDSAHADILIAMMGLDKKTNRLKLKLENKVKELEAIKAGQARYYNESYGAALQTQEAQLELQIRAALEANETKQLQAAGTAEMKNRKEEYKRSVI